MRALYFRSKIVFSGIQIPRVLCTWTYDVNIFYLLGEDQGSGSWILLKLCAGWDFGYSNMKKAAILDPNAKKN